MPKLMGNRREVKNARAALRGFNVSRGKKYQSGDEADLCDLLIALKVLADNNTHLYGSFNAQLQRANASYNAEVRP